MKHLIEFIQLGWTFSGVVVVMWISWVGFVIYFLSSNARRGKKWQ